MQVKRNLNKQDRRNSKNALARVESDWSN